MALYQQLYVNWQALAKLFPYRRSSRDVYPHVIRTSQNYQLSMKNLYYLISFISINLKILILIDNYGSYYMQVFLELDM